MSNGVYYVNYINDQGNELFNAINRYTVNTAGKVTNDKFSFLWFPNFLKSIFITSIF